jgi:hypothetical protein
LEEYTAFTFWAKEYAIQEAKCHLLLPGFLPALFFDPEDENSVFLYYYMVLHPRRLYSSSKNV